MSLHERTFRREVEKILRGYYEEGRIPRPIELEQAIKDFLENNPPGRPRLKLRPQQRRTRLNLEHFNAQNAEIVEDLQILHDGLVGIIEDQTKNIAVNQGVVSALERQVRTIEDSLEDLVITTRGAGAYLFSVPEKFNTLNNIDRAATTATIDLANQVATLRRQVRGTRRIPMTHWVPDPNNTAEGSEEPVRQPLISIINGEQVELVQETALGNALVSFSDRAFMLVYSAPEAPVTVRLEFRVPPEGERFVRIGRLDVSPIGEFDLRVFHTNENREERQNFIYFPGFEANHRIDRSRSFLFESRNVSWMRLEMTKNAPDRVEQRPDGTTVGIYQFGMKSLEFYQQGFAQNSILQTKPLLPEGSEFMEAVGKVTLEAEERAIPEGSQINWSVRLDEDDSPWVPIAPVNRPIRDTAQVVDFGGAIVSPRRDNQLRVTSPALHERRNAIDFYELTTLPNTPVFGTARLYPGIGAWKENTALEERLRTVRQNFLVYTANDDNQHLYLTERDEEAVRRTVDAKVQLDLQNLILEQEGMPLIPGGQVGVDQNPLYSIERVLRIVVDGAVAGNSGHIIRKVGRSPELGLGTTVVDPELYVGQFVYINDGSLAGYFKISATYESASPAETVLVLDSVGSLSGTTVQWRLDIQDVTDSAESIDNRTVVMKSGLIANDDDRFLVTYRHRLNANQEIVEGSVEVRLPGSNDILVQGVDYALRVGDKSVQRLSDKINAGAGSTVSAIADFQVRELVEGLTSYTTYVDLDSEKEIEVPAIQVDRAAGEFFRILPVGSSPSSAVEDATSAAKWKLNGTVVIVVESSPLFRADGTIDTGSAIYKVINRKDGSGNDIFDPGRYFDRMYAEPEPMEQTTQTRLRALAPNDNSQFFVSSLGAVVVNFNPVGRDDLLTVLPGTSSEQTYADFEIGYQFVPTENSGVKQVLVRAELSRDANTDGSVTPAIESFVLRFS